MNAPGSTTRLAPAPEARFLAVAALAVTLGFAAWMATLPETLDTLWPFVAIQAVPLAVKDWRGFRTSCFWMGAGYLPLAFAGALLGWFLLLPAALLLFVAGGVARPAPPETGWADE